MTNSPSFVIVKEFPNLRIVAFSETKENAELFALQQSIRDSCEHGIYMLTSTTNGRVIKRLGPTDD